MALFPTATPGSLSSSGGSSGWRSDVVHSKKRALLEQDGKRRILDRTEPSRLYQALGRSLRLSKADKAFLRNWTLRKCRNGRTRPVEENRAGRVFILFIDERLTETARCIPSRNITAAAVTAVFLKYRVYA